MANIENKARTNCLKDTEYFMGIAVLSSHCSTDPKTQVGACIVNDKNQIIGTGYNDLPNGCNADDFPWIKNENDLENCKLSYIVHAEVNAIINRNSTDAKGCTLYTTEFPCNECTKIIIQSGIKNIIYKSDKNPNGAKTIASKRMLNAVHMNCMQYNSETDLIHLNLK